MNTYRSLNNTISSKLVSLSRLFIEYAKAHKTKVIIHSILLVFSTYVISSVRFKLLPLMPSVLPADVTSLINFIISKLAALYLISFMFYWYFKYTPIKRELIISTLIVVIIGIVMWLFLLFSDFFQNIKGIFFPLSDVSVSDFYAFLAAIAAIISIPLFYKK